MRRVLTFILGALLCLGSAVAQSAAPGNVPGFDPMQGVGLSISIRPGTVFCSGSFTKYGGGSFNVPNNSTTYFYLDTSAGCLVKTKSTSFNVTDIPIATVVTQNGYIVGFYDQRPRFWSVGGTGTGGSMTWPDSPGVMVYNGSFTYGTSLVAPSSDLVGINDTQTLINKTIDGVTPQTFGFLDASSSIQNQLNSKVPINRTINGHPLSGDVSISLNDLGVSGVSSVSFLDQFIGDINFTPINAYPDTGYVDLKPHFENGSNRNIAIEAPIASNSLLGLVQCDGVTVSCASGVASSAIGGVVWVTSPRDAVAADDGKLVIVNAPYYSLPAAYPTPRFHVWVMPWQNNTSLFVDSGTFFNQSLNTIIGSYPLLTGSMNYISADVTTTSHYVGSLQPTNYALLSGGQYTGRLVTTQSTTTTAGFNIIPGVAPTNPINGDLWITSAGLYVRVGGTTIGPLGTGTGGGGSGTVASGGSYAISAYGSTASTAVGPVGIKTDSTGINLLLPGYVASGTLPPTAVVGSATGIWGCYEASTVSTPTASEDALRCDAATHHYLVTLNGGAEFDSLLNYSLASSLTFTGKLTSAVPTTTAAGFNLAPGVAPTNPTNGDIWTTSAGLYVRINGSTVGPLGTGSGSGNGTVTSGSGYAMTAYGNTASTTVSPINVKTDSTGNNLLVPGFVAFGTTPPTAVVGTATGIWGCYEAATSATPTAGQSAIRCDSSHQYKITLSGGSEFISLMNYSLASNLSFTGKITTATPSTSAAGLNLPHGAAPTSPTNGDIWTTTAGLYVRINGTTVGPLGTGGGSGSGTVNTSATQYALGFYSTTGTAISPDALLLDNQTTLAYTGTGGMLAPVLATNGTGNGYVNLKGTGTGASAPGTGTVQITVPNSVTAYTRTLAGAAPSASSVGVYSTAGVEAWKSVSGSGAGIVTGPSSSVAGRIVTFADTVGTVQDSGTLLSALAPLASPTFTGKVTTAASTTGGASLNIPHGAAPTTPADGDVWTTTSGMFVRINGSTVGPFGTGGGGMVYPAVGIALSTGSAWSSSLAYAATTGLLYDTAGTLAFSTTLPTAAEPAHTGDAQNTAGSLAMTVKGINGTALSSLATGLLKNTTTTGVPTIAAAGTDYVAPSTTVNGHALSANVSVTASDVGLGSVTNAAQTLASVVPNTAPSTGQILVGNSGGTAYAPQTMGGDGTLASTGQLTITKSSGVSFGTGAFATIANYAALSGATFTGKLTTLASASGGAGINLPHGAAPTSPSNGDIWTTTTGLYVQINGSTIGPLGTGGGGGSGTVSSSATQYALGYYSVTGTTIGADTLLLDNQTTLAYTGAGGITAPVIAATGTSNGYLNLKGTGTGASAPGTGTVQITVPNTVTAYTRTLAGAAPAAASVGVYSTSGVESWLPAAGAGSGFVTGPIASTTVGRVVTYADTVGTVQDSGTLLSALAPLVSPSFTTPTLGAATATTINKVTVTAPATSATLTLVNGSTLQTTGAFTLNLTATATTTPTFPSGTHTLSGLDVAETFSGVKSFTARPKSTVGFEFTQGTSQTAGTTSIILQAPSSVTSYVVTQPGTGPANSNMMKSYSALASSVTTESFVQAPRKSMLTSAYTNATATPSTIFSFTVDASTSYTVHCAGLYKAASGGAFTFGVTGPTTPTLVTYKFKPTQSITTNTPTYAVFSSTGSTYPTGINTTAVGTSATDMEFEIDMGFTNGTTAGTLALTGATLSTNTLTVESGSYCYAY